MKFVESKHFLKRWKERIGGGYNKYRIHKLMSKSIKTGNCRIQRNLGLGIMIPITIKKGAYYVTGIAIDEHQFLMKTILTEEMARNMKWIPQLEESIITLGDMFCEDTSHNRDTDGFCIVCGKPAVDAIETHESSP